MKPVHASRQGLRQCWVAVCLSECEVPFCAWLCSRQSCARACCGASLRRSRCASTALRYSLSRPHRGTRCVRFALYARTTAMRMMRKRAARAALKGPFLGVAEAHRSPPERSFAERWLVFAANYNAISSLGVAVVRESLGRFFYERYWGLAAASSNAASSRQAVSGGGDFCGGEERSTRVGARSALRNLTHRGCPNGVNEVNKVSSAMRPWCEHRSGVDTKCDRHSMSPRWVPSAATRAPPQEAIARPLAVPQGFSCTNSREVLRSN